MGSCLVFCESQRTYGSRQLISDAQAQSSHVGPEIAGNSQRQDLPDVAVPRVQCRTPLHQLELHAWLCKNRSLEMISR
jgi:hypothetical protein